MSARLNPLWLVLAAVMIAQAGRAQDEKDPVSLLACRLETGTEKLGFDAKRGYLPALLKALHVPASSQVLAFSKTSSQADCTSPLTPRAIYFSDTVSIACVPGSKEIDVAAVDPQKGSVFYTLEQSSAKAPRFMRHDDCLECHQSRKTLDVPAWLVRSVYTGSNGATLGTVDGFISGHNSPLEIRWGGWYVTGAPSGMPHLGNRFTPDAEHLDRGTSLSDAQMRALRHSFNAKGYVADTSDLVALLVLEHQVRMQSLFMLANREWAAIDAGLHSSEASTHDAAQKRLRNIGDMLISYMLFRDEAPLTVPVTSQSKFAREFQRSGPFDSRGRSLRQFDLQQHLFRFPCSYLIYSPSFDALPDTLRAYLWERLSRILQGNDRSAPYGTLDSRARQGVLEILSATKPEFRAVLNRGLDQ